MAKDDDDFSEPAPDHGAGGRAPKRRGPPDDWEGESWFDFAHCEWWFNFQRGGWRLDPPPVQPRGHKLGEYFFVTAVGEVRPWKSSALHGRGGMADLFGGDLRWATRHYPGEDSKGKPTGRPNAATCMERLIWVCTQTDYLDAAIKYRKAGIWAEVDGPLVHSGNRLFYNGEELPPGTLIGDMLYTVGGRKPPPAHEVRGREIVWLPASAADGLGVMSDLSSWHWATEEHQQLYGGGLFLCMLGDAPVWKNHMFVQAPPEAGKSTLLRYTHNLLGGSAGPKLKTFSKAFIERTYSGMGLAVVLDEMESDTESDRIKNLFELLRALSDDGAEGGRAAEGGGTREFNVHGPVIMAATVRERWRPQDRRRVQLLELRPLKDRNQAQDSKATINRLIKAAAEKSAAMRARALVQWPLYLKNFAIAHDAVMALGGTSGDGDQLGGLIAGWWTLTLDRVAGATEIDDVSRFAEFIRSKVEAEAGDDDPTNCFNFLLGAEMHGVWRGGEMFTVGQMIARAREADSVDGETARKALHRKGLRLIVEKGQPWATAWLAIANKHNGLNDIYQGAAEYGGEKWNQIMKGLPGAQTVHPFKKDNPPIRFAGPPSRALFVPAVLLPELSDESE